MLGDLTDQLIVWLATVICFTAALIFYLGCPNQQWLRARLFGFYFGLTISLVLLALSLWLFSQRFSVLSSSFIVVQLASLFLGVIPLVSQHSSPSPPAIKRKTTLEKSSSAAPSQFLWHYQVATGLLLGLPLALAICGWFAWLQWGEGDLGDRTQWVMWSTALVWLICLSAVFFIRRVKTLMLSFIGLNGVAFGVLWLIKSGA